MAKRRFNWSLAIVLLLSFAVLATTAVLLRNWRKSHRAEQGLARGNQAFEQENWEEAASQLGRYISIVPDDVDILLKYAQANLRIRPLKRGSIQQALGAYRNILRLDKSNLDASRQLADLYLNMKAPAEAEFVAREALENQHDPQLTILLASAESQQRKFIAAGETLRSLIEDHPDEVMAYAMLGQLIQQRPEDFPHESPADWFNLAVDKNPQAPEAYVSRAQFHLTDNRPQQAKADLAQARALTPTRSGLLVALAKLSMQLGQLNEAEQHLAQAQQDDPTSPALWETKAELALRRGDTDQIIAVAQNGLQSLGYRKWDFLPTAVDLLLQADSLDLADQYIDEIKTAEIHVPRLHFYEGRLAQARRQTREAAEHYRNAIAQGYDNLQSRTALAEVLFQLGEPRTALQQLRSLIANQPDNHEAHAAFARMLLQTGNPQQAVDHARLALQSAPNRQDNIALYVRAHIQSLTTADKTLDQATRHELQNLLDSLAADGQSTPLGILRIQLYRACGELDKADALLQELKHADRHSLQLGITEVDLLQAQGDTAAAIDRLRQLVQEHPQAATPSRMLATALFDEYPDEAAKVLTDAINRIPVLYQQRELTFLLAALYKSQQRPHQAHEALTAFAQRWPNDVPVRRLLLRSDTVAADEQATQNILEQIKNIDGETGQTWRREQARAWLNSPAFERQYSQIIALLKDNLRDDPDDQESRLLLAATYQKHGKGQLAANTYRQAYERSPRSLAVIVPFVAALHQAGEFEEADRVTREAAQHDLTHPALSRLELQGQLARGHLEASVEILEGMLNESPANNEGKILLASLKLQRKEYAQVQALLDDVDKTSENEFAAARLRVQLCLAQNQYDQAVAACNRMVSQHDGIEAHLLRATTFVAVHDQAKAVQDLDTLMARSDMTSATFVDTSELYRRLGLPERAVQAARLALELDPQDSRVRQTALRTMLAAPDEDSRRLGHALLENSLQLYPDAPELRILKAEHLLSQATAPELDQARTILEKVTQDSPTAARAWVLLGEMALSQGHPGKAADLALQGLASSSNSKELMLLKATAEAVHSPQLAVATLRTCHDTYPEDTAVALRLADAHLLAGQPDQAVKLLTDKIQQLPPEYHPQLNIALAAALYKKGQKDQAMQMLDDAIAANPDSAAPLLTQAMLLKDDQRWDHLQQRFNAWNDGSESRLQTIVDFAANLAWSEDPQGRQAAQALLRQVLERNHEHERASMSLAELLQIDHSFAEAGAIYERVLAANPKNVVAMNNLAWLYCEHQDRYHDALTLADKALQLAPEYLDLHDTRAVIYLRLGQYPQAESDLKLCLERYPTHATARTASYFHLGQVLLAQDKPTQAAEALTLALEANRQHGGLSQNDLAEIENLRPLLPEGEKP